VQGRSITALVLLAAGVTWWVPMQPGNDGEPLSSARDFAADVPRFSVAIRRGKLAVTGHTLSAGHEQSLRKTANEAFADLEFSGEFSPLGLVPDWWETATTELLGSLSTVGAARATLSPDALKIRGLVTNPAAVERRFQALGNFLPEGTRLEFDLTAFQPLSSEDALCKRQFRSLRVAPIYFEESGTSMRASAYPVLEQVLALADACRQATVTITGHTDSTGNESWNQQLSLARARIVGEWLEEHGVTAERLQVRGAGSSLPIADNATRYGRSLNRRIDVGFAEAGAE
jgi:OOP family OmpA-OmpF porin